MATQVASLFGVLSLDDKDFKRGVKDADKDMTGIGDRLKGLGGNLTSLGSDLTMVGAPFLAFAGLAVKSAADAEAGTAQLEAVLKSTGGTAGVTKDSALALASKLESLTTFSDDAVLSAENMLLTFTNIGKDVFPDATMTTLNMSKALGQDLKSSSIQLGKALNDPVAGITALSRVGVTFTEQQKAQIETMVKAGDVAGAQRLILEELGREFGGSATAAADTFSGRLEQMANKFDNLMEAIGEKLMPVAEQFIDWVGQAIEWFTTLDPNIQNIILGVVTFMGALAVIGPVIAAVGVGLTAIGGILGAIGGAIAFVLSPIGLVIAAVVGLAAAYFTNFGGVRDFIDNNVRPILENVFNWMAGVWENTIKPGLEALRIWFVETAFPAIGKAVEDFKTNIFEPVATFIGNVWENIIGPGLEKLREWFIDTAFPAIGKAVNDFKTNIFEPVATFIGDIWTLVGKGLGLFFDWMAAPGGGLDQIKVALNNFKTNVLEPVIKFIQDIWTKVQPFLDSFKSGIAGVFNWIKDNVIQPIIDKVQWLIDTIHKLAGEQPTSGQMMQNGLPANMQMSVPGRAGGGSVMGGRPYLVGEQGPELFTPSSSGNISTAGETAGMMGGWTINGGIHIHANSEAEGQSAMRGALAAARARGY
jgi:hypothetical protein